MKRYLSKNTADIKKLLAFILDKSITWIYINEDYKLTGAEQKKLEDLISQRQKGMPFAYLTGVQGFYHLDFIVNKHTLIPRPETEIIIEVVKALRLNNCTMLDLGTGSGAIAITLKSLFPNWEVFASDIAVKALKIAKENSLKNNTKIDFKKSYWLNDWQGERFDMIISNPPYIEANNDYLKALRFEPQSALVANNNGLADIENIIKNAPNYLNKNGYLILEHGYNQQQDVFNLLTEFNNIQVFNDYNDKNRVILAQLKN